MTRLVESRIIHLNGCERSRIVLTDRGTEHERYVTHVEVLPTDRPAFLVWGHYFDDLVEATEEFGERFLKDVEQERAQQQVVAA